MNIEAVLFDLDGTLIDSSGDFIQALNQVLKEHGHPPLAEDSIRCTVSDGARALTQLAFGGQPEEAEFERNKQKLLDKYLELIGQYSLLFPGMERLLQQLEQQAIPWGLITNKPALYAEPLLRFMNLDQRCSCLICPDHVKHSKPDPEGLLKACQILEVQAEHCLYIGDHQRDIEAGKAAGMTTITAGFGFISATEDPHTWQADYYIADSQDLSPLISQLQQGKS